MGKVILSFLLIVVFTGFAQLAEIGAEDHSSADATPTPAIEPPTVDATPLLRPEEPMDLSLEIGEATGNVNVLSNMGIGTASPYGTFHIVKDNWQAINLGTSSDPSVNQGNRGITWGYRSDGNPYYMIKTDYKTYGSHTYSRLQIGWHTGLEIGAASSYGGTRFFNNSPFIGSQIMSIGDGDNHVRINNDLWVGSAGRWMSNTAPASGSGNYIWNGTGAQSANFNITGNGIFNSYGYIHHGPTGIGGQANGWKPTPYSSQGVWIENTYSEGGGFYADGDVAAIWSPGDLDLLRIYDEDYLNVSDPNAGIRAKFDGSGNLHVPFIYDINNTGYYCDPNGSSRLSSTYTDETYYYGWLRKLGSNSTGLYWQEGTGQYWHIYPASQQDMRFRTGSGNGGIVGTIADETARGYIHWTTSNEIGFLHEGRGWQLRCWNGAQELYGTTYMNSANSYYYHNRYGIGTDHPFGIYFNPGDAAYAIYRESGAWSHPYPDLRIAFHTGIKLGANASYEGIRFYNDYNMATLVMSVNDANTSGANNVRVAYNLSVGCNHTYDIIMDNAGGEQTIRPNYGNWGYCGTSSYYWYRFYSNYKSAIKPNPFIAGSEIAREDGGIDKSVRNYCTESIKYTVEDWGVGQLQSGEVRVEFYEYTKIWLSPFIKPIVTITPMGDCKGLYVADISPEGFTVKELMGGNSNVKFSWRLAGIRAGDEVISSVVDEELDKIMSDNKGLRTQNPEKPENRQSLIEYTRIMFREAKARGFVTALEQLELTTEGEALLESMR